MIVNTEKNDSTNAFTGHEHAQESGTDCLPDGKTIGCNRVPLNDLQRIRDSITSGIGNNNFQLQSQLNLCSINNNISSNFNNNNDDVHDGYSQHNLIDPFPSQKLISKPISNRIQQYFHIISNDSCSDKYKYQCKQCKKILCTKSGALGHINIHLGIKKHQCRFCQQKFGHKTTKDRHELIHTGEKPFQCKICQKRFRVKSILKNHYTTHSKNKNYHCVICGKSYAQHSSLRRHNKSKHG